MPSPCKEQVFRSFSSCCLSCCLLKNKYTMEISPALLRAGCYACQIEHNCVYSGVTGMVFRVFLADQNRQYIFAGRQEWYTGRQRFEVVGMKLKLAFSSQGKGSCFYCVLESNEACAINMTQALAAALCFHWHPILQWQVWQFLSQQGFRLWFIPQWQEPASAGRQSICVLLCSMPSILHKKNISIHFE